MKRIVLFSRDPGGANTIIPLVKPLMEKYEVLLYGKDVALEKYQMEQLQGKDILEECKEITLETVEAFLKKHSPDFIITGTSADDYAEKYLWKSGEKLGIPSFAILDQWVNYGIRFSRYGVNQIEEYWKQKTFEYLPEKIIVMDEYAKKCMIKEGIEADKILVCGQPYFEHFVKNVQRISDKDIENCKKNWGVQKNEICILFASEPITKTYQTKDGKGAFGYTEQTIFRVFQKILETKAESLMKKVRVLVRPHPKEDREWWNMVLKDTEYVSYQLDIIKDSKVAIKSADYICGMTSMFLIESAICQKPILSIQIGLNCENSFILEKKGVLESVFQEAVLEKKIVNLLEGKYPVCNVELPLDASGKIICEMERWL